MNGVERDGDIKGIEDPNEGQWGDGERVYEFEYDWDRG